MAGLQRNDLEYEWLVNKGMALAQLNDMWLEYLTGLGYTGSLDDMKHDYWAAGGG